MLLKVPSLFSLNSFPSMRPAFLGTALLHAGLLGWLMTGSAAGPAGQGARDSLSTLRVTLIAASPAAAASTISRQVGMADRTMRPGLVSQPRLEAPVAPQNSNALGKGGPGTDSVVAYFPAEALTKMPEPMTQLDSLLEIKNDIGTGGKLTLRLWINEAGNIERVRLLEAEVPSDLSAAALAAFHQMRFQPAEINGAPVRAWLDIALEYADLSKQ